MENINYAIIAILSLYFLFDFYRNKHILKTRPLLILGIYNALFLIGVISVVISNPDAMSQFWWLILLMGLPSALFQIVKFRSSAEPIR